MKQSFQLFCLDRFTKPILLQFQCLEEYIRGPLDLGIELMFVFLLSVEILSSVIGHVLDEGYLFYTSWE